MRTTPTENQLAGRPALHCVHGPSIQATVRVWWGKKEAAAAAAAVGLVSGHAVGHAVGHVVGHAVARCAQLQKPHVPLTRVRECVQLLHTIDSYFYFAV